MDSRISRRKFLALTAAVSGTALVAACAPAAAPGAEDAAAAETYLVNHWSWLGASDAEVWGVHIENFNEAHADKGIQIEKLDVSSNEYKTKVLASAATGQAPDFGWAGSGERADFISDGIMIPIEEPLAEAGLDWSDFTDLSLHRSRYPQFNNQLYHMPLDAMTWQMEINLDHVEEAGLDISNPPSNSEELIEWSKAMTVLEGDTVVRSGFLMTGSGLHVAFIWGLVSYQMGFRAVNDELTEACINPDAAKEAAQWTLDLFDKHKIATRDVTDRYKAFGTGEGSMFITGPWTLNGYIEQGLNFAVDFVPNIGGELATRLSVGSQEMYIQEDESRYARSAETLVWLSDESFLWTTEGRGAACRKSILEREDYRAHRWEYRQPFVEGMDFANFAFPNIKAAPDFQYYTSPNLVHRITDPIWLGEKTIDEGVDELCAAWNQLLAEEMEA